MKRLLPAVGITLCLTACLGDPVGPHGTLVLVRVGGSPSDSLLIGAPGRILPQLLQFRLIDGDGRPVPAATVTWSVETGNGRIEDAATTTAQDGTLGARWLLGTKAGDSQQFEVMAREGSHVATAKLKAIPVPVEVASLKILTDTAVRVGVAALVHAEATDPFGNRFVPKGLRFATLDTTLAVVDSAGDLRALRRGFARLTATASGVSDTALVHGIQIVKAIQVDRDTVSYHSLGQGQAVKVTLVDDQGQPVPDSFPSVAPSDTGIIEIQTADGLVIQSRANGVATVALNVGSVSRQVVALVQQTTASLEFVQSALQFDALNDTSRTTLVAQDSLGVMVATPKIAFSSSDTTVTKVDSTGLARSLGNGRAVIAARAASGAGTTIPVTVAQRVVSISLGQDSLTFSALQAASTIVASPRDRLGSVVAGATLAYSSTNAQVASVDGSGQVRARANGVTSVTAAYGGVVASLRVVVDQVPVDAGLVVRQQEGFSFSGVEDSIGSLWASDANGYRLPITRWRLTSFDSTRVYVDSLGTLHAIASGQTEIRASIDSFSVASSLLVVVPVRVLIDSMPGFRILGEDGTWSPGPPTALGMADGTTRLFFTGYEPDSTQNPAYSGNLLYATSSDGITFSLAGVALPRDTFYYGYRSQGIENVYMVPRDDGPGCRLFAAAGSSWWVWQVFSAVSADCEHWTWEDSAAVPGIVESDGTTRGTGEGIYSWQDSTGTWWMLLGAYPPAQGDVKTWSIGLYRASSQRQWQFVKTVFYPGPLGSGRERAVFGPSVTQFAPGLYRMFFTGDNLGLAGDGGRSKIWSAVSRDRINWTLEGVVLDSHVAGGGPAYPTVVNDRLYYQMKTPQHTYPWVAQIQQR